MKINRELDSSTRRIISQNAELAALLTDVVSQPELAVEIRDNYISVYYRGGSLVRISVSHRTKKPSFHMDSKYLYPNRNNPVPTDEELRQWLDGKPYNPAEWHSRIPQIERTMDQWFKAHPKPEREVQQLITSDLTFEKTVSWQAIDIELQIPREKAEKAIPSEEAGSVEKAALAELAYARTYADTQCSDLQELSATGLRTQFGSRDIVAVRRDGNRLVPVIIELKHGTGSLKGRSGIADHYDKITRMLEAVGQVDLVGYIRSVWSAKNFLGVIKEPVPSANNFVVPEIMFAVTGLSDAEADRMDSVREYLQRQKTGKWPVLLSVNSGVDMDLSKTEHIS